MSDDPALTSDASAGQMSTQMPEYVLEQPPVDPCVSSAMHGRSGLSSQQAFSLWVYADAQDNKYSLVIRDFYSGRSKIW